MRRRRVLLVNPWIEDFAAYDFWLKPVGLLYVGALLRRLGVDVELIDLMNRYDRELQEFTKVPKDKFYGTGKFPYVEIPKPRSVEFVPRRYKRYGMPEELFRRKLRKIAMDKVDAVFVTSTLTYWYPGYFDTITVVREELGNVPIVFGGFFVRNQPHIARRSDALLFTSTDLSLLPEFLNRHLGWGLTDVNLDWFGELSPAYDLYERVGYVVLITTLGCTFRCTYCITHRNWELKFKPVKRVIEEIAHFSELLGVQDIVFFDDAILMNADKHFKLILREIIRSGLNKKLRFHLPNGIHARLLTQEISDLMFEANFKTIKLGYETSGRLQRETGGKIYDYDLMSAVAMLKRSGFTHREVMAYIMVNLPGQTEEDVMEAVDVCASLGIDFSINEFTPIVGTQIWIDLVNEGLLTGLEDPLLLNNTVLPYWWGNMSIEQIQRLKEYGRIKKELELKFREVGEGEPA